MICHRLAQSTHQILLLSSQHSVLSLSHEISHGETFKKLYSSLFGYYRKSVLLNNTFYRVCCHIFTQMFNPNVDRLYAWRPLWWHRRWFLWLDAWCIHSSKTRKQTEPCNPTPHTHIQQKQNKKHYHLTFLTGSQTNCPFWQRFCLESGVFDFYYLKATETGEVYLHSFLAWDQHLRFHCTSR